MFTRNSSPIIGIEIETTYEAVQNATHTHRSWLELVKTAQLVNGKLKAQIREEAEELNFFPKTAKLPL